MVNIYNYLKTAFQDLRSESSKHPFLPLVVLLLLTIPLSYLMGSVALGIFAVAIVFYCRRLHFVFNPALFFAVLLYLLMLLSLSWSVNPDATLKSLSKELPLLIVPVGFMLFPAFSSQQKQLILKFYSWGIFGYCVFYLVKAIIRFAATSDTGVFFYHELVTKDVNAIHVSVYVAVAFFCFFVKPVKALLDYVALLVLLLMVFLLSSKNIIVVFAGLILLHQLFYTKTSKKLRLKNLVLLLVLLCSLMFVGKIKERFRQEYETIMVDSSVNDVLFKRSDNVYNVSIKQAWTNESFKPNDYFPGTAFRVYQLRIFCEMLHEDPIFWTGYGLNASYAKIEQKSIQYNLFLGNAEQEGYQKKNFHNQYIQNFAELGVFGFLLLIAMLLLNLRNAIKSKDFVHIAFGILMISLFLTESFLWRQRGVMFFTVLYCLFNARPFIAPEKDN